MLLRGISFERRDCEGLCLDVENWEVSWARFWERDWLIVVRPAISVWREESSVGGGLVKYKK